MLPSSNSGIKPKNFEEFQQKKAAATAAAQLPVVPVAKPGAAPKQPTPASSKAAAVAKDAFDDFENEVVLVSNQKTNTLKVESSKPKSKAEIKEDEKKKKAYEENLKKQNLLAKRSEEAEIMRKAVVLHSKPAAAPAAVPKQENEETERIDINAKSNNKPALNVTVVPLKRQFSETYINNALKDLDQIVLNITDSLFKTMVDGKIKEHANPENVSSITTQLKNLAKGLLNLGDIADKQFAKLCEFNFIDSAAKKDYMFLLNWVISNESIDADQVENHRKALHARVYKELTENKIVETFHYPFLDQALFWIFDAKHERPFQDYIQEIDINMTDAEKMEQGKKVCRLVLKALVDIKIELYCNELQRILQTQLGQLLLHQVRDHLVLPLAHVKTEHLMETIQGLKWKEIVDNMIYTLKDHTGATIFGNQGKENYEKFTSKLSFEDVERLKKWKEYLANPNQFSPSERESFEKDRNEYEKLEDRDLYSSSQLSAEDVEKLIQWKEYLSNPKQFSPEERENFEKNRVELEKLATQETEYLRILDEQFWINFSIHHGSVTRARLSNDGKTEIPTSRTVHPVVERIIADKRSRTKEDLAKRSEDNNTDVFFSKKAEQVVDLIFSSDMNGIDFWIQHLSLSDDFKKYASLAMDLAHKVVSTRVFETFDNFAQDKEKTDIAKRMFNKFLKSCVVGLKSKMKEIITQQLKAQLERWSDPDQLKQLFADTLLPNVIIPKLVFIIAKQQFFADFDNYAKLMLGVVNAGSPELEEKKLNDLRKKLYDKTDLQLPNAPLKDLGKAHGDDKINEAGNQSQQFFATTMRPLLENVIAGLKAIREKNGSIDLETVKININSLLNSESPTKELEKNPQYEELIHNLFFEMSDLKNNSSRELWEGSAKKVFTELLISSLDDMRKSPEQLVNLLMGTFSAMYAAGKPCDDALNGPKGKSRQELRDELADLENKRKEIIESSVGQKRSDALQKIGKEINAHPINSTNRKFNDYMRRTTDLIYDFALKAIGDATYSSLRIPLPILRHIPLFGAATAVQKISKSAVLGDPTYFNKLITDLYNQLFGNPLCVRSMTFQIADDLVTALFKESDRIHKETKKVAEKAHNDAQEKARLEKEIAAEAERKRIEQEVEARLRPILEKETREKIRLEQLAAARARPTHKRNASN